MHVMRMITSMIDCLDEIQHRPTQAPTTDICCAAAGADVLTPPAAPIVTETVSETGSSSFYGKVKCNNPDLFFISFRYILFSSSARLAG